MTSTGSEPRRWRADELEVVRVEECVEMPCCGFTYDANHSLEDAIRCMVIYALASDVVGSGGE